MLNEQGLHPDLWIPDPTVPLPLKGGFGGFVVRHSVTGKLGYFKVRNYKFDVVCANLSRLAGVSVPEIEFAKVGERQGAVSHFWGDASINVVGYTFKQGMFPPELLSATGILALVWWLGYGDVRNEHILWSSKGLAFIDYDSVFGWTHHKYGHLVGPSILFRNFNAESLKEMSYRIQGISYDQIYNAFTSMRPEFYRFRREEETRFSTRLFNEAQALPETMRRYWERGVMDRDKFPQLDTQDKNIWLKTLWRKQVESCEHDFNKRDGLWHCSRCSFYWPLQGDPDKAATPGM